MRRCPPSLYRSEIRHLASYPAFGSLDLIEIRRVDRLQYQFQIVSKFINYRAPDSARIQKNVGKVKEDERPAIHHQVVRLCKPGIGDTPRLEFRTLAPDITH